MIWKRSPDIFKFAHTVLDLFCQYLFICNFLGNVLAVCCMIFVSVLQELAIRHPLHRKKLQLALQSLSSEEEDAMGKLDYNWVTRKLQQSVMCFN